ncbi:MAG: hypothetical protein JWO22_1724 [Frankiales bacterium]|nr:hypothetical protein [Frankiales bacterium]
MTKRIALLLLALTAACGGASSTPHAVLGSAPSSAPAVVQPVSRPAVTAKPSPSLAPRPHFRTPQAAMRFMARAWNDGNAEHLKWVTEPNVRNDLQLMHREAMNLRLKSCEKDDSYVRGDYLCTFVHDYPVGYQGYRGPGGVGSATFVAGPVSRTGWYMTEYITCG